MQEYVCLRMLPYRSAATDSKLVQLEHPTKSELCRSLARIAFVQEKEAASAGCHLIVSRWTTRTL